MREIRLAAVALIASGLCAACAAPRAAGSTPGEGAVVLSTIAFRVHHMDAMVSFYTEAFGARVRPVDTFGLASQFGELGGLTLKFVPLRDRADFEGFPDHQLGFEVEDVDAIVALAEKHGGRREGDVLRTDGRVHASVRDPDGNTIELYSGPGH